MKLNYKRTILVGFAFFLITAFWQAYDATIPVILTNKFGMSQTWSGVVMALDNIFAVFMLPIFGALSDKSRSRYGRRTPFILIGTIIAAAMLVCLAFADNAQFKSIEGVAQLDNPTALETVYDAKKDTTLMTPEGDKFVLGEKMTREEFVNVKSTDEYSDGEENLYTNYVVPARQDYIGDLTRQNPANLFVFLAFLLAVLIAMSLFRSPAVALMPDVTVKPLRSKANAVINLMGTFGGIIVLVLGIVFGTSAVKNSFMSYYTFYGIVAAIMVASLAVFLLTVKEVKWAKEQQEQSLILGEEKEEGEKRSLTKGQKWSLAFILASIALWYIGYNAITSKYAIYAQRVLEMDYNTTLLLAQGAAIISYLPAGMVASKFGRKKTILAGVVMLAAAFLGASFMRAGSSVLVMNALFCLAGIAWATINVNSFPMAVEMCSGSDVGKYTGFYYTASMAAQIVTPMLSGFIMDKMGMTTLFPYATIFVSFAFVTMMLVKHGDSKAVLKKDLIENLQVED